MKKQRLKNYLKLGILLFGISIILNNCQTYELTFNANKHINAKTVSFDEAKSFFNDNSQIEIFGRGTTVDQLILEPDWNTLEHSDLIYTDAQLTKADTDVNRDGNYTSNLLFVNIDNLIQSIIYTTWVEDYDNDGNIVNAIVYFNDYDGIFIDAYKIENGMFTKRLVPPANVSSASFFILLQTLTDGDCWNTDNLPEDGELDEVDIGTVSSGGGGSNAGSGPGPGHGPGGNGGSYGGYVNGAVGSVGGSWSGSGGTSGGITVGGVGVGVATIFMNPMSADQTISESTQNHLDALAEFTEYNIIKDKIDWLQGRLYLNNEFGFQFTQTGTTYSIEDGVPNADGDGIYFPAPQENTILEIHTHHLGLDPVFSIDDVFATAKLFNAHGNLNATSIVITTPTRMYALRIDDATKVNEFFDFYNDEGNFKLLKDDYESTVVEYAQWACGGNCTDAQYQNYLNYYLNQLLQGLDSGLQLFAGLENSDGTITWTNFN